MIAPNAGIAAYSSWLPTIVCVLILLTSHSHSLRLCLFVTEKEAFTITSKQRAESACNFLFFIIMLVLLVTWMSVSGANKGDKCPSSFF